MAGWVLRRRVRDKHGLTDTARPWEHAYALSFLVFGLSDVLESQVVPLWLVAAKGLIFAALLICRWQVVTRYYPEAKL